MTVTRHHRGVTRYRGGGGGSGTENYPQGFDPFGVGRNVIDVNNTSAQVSVTTTVDDTTYDLRGATLTAAHTWNWDDTHNITSWQAPGPWPSAIADRDYSGAGTPSNRFPVSSGNPAGGPKALAIIGDATTLITFRAHPDMYWDENKQGLQTSSHAFHLASDATSFLLVRGGKIYNGHDGIRPQQDGWNLEDVWMQGMRDDCVENDNGKSGAIRRCLLQGHTFLSIQGVSATGKTVRIEDSLIELTELYSRGDNDGTGYTARLRQVNSTSPLELAHKNWKAWGHVWKQVASSGATLVISNTRFLVPSSFSPNQGWDWPTTNITCTNVTLHWLGGGAYPGTLPSSGVTTVTTRTDFDAAVNQWKLDHGYTP